MSEREPEHNESTDEEVWKDLVARLEHMDDAGPAPDTRPSPPADPGPEASGAPASPGTASPAERTRALFENQALAGGPRDYAVPDEQDGAFVPPEPPPLGLGEPTVVLAWLGAVGGPLLLLVFAMFWRSAPLAVILGTVAVFVGSAGYLLFRLPQYRDEGDDGAAV
ncbi:hypothetical protein LJ754_11140 [Arthrobacter sp. zg-Y40]|uniref:hypothetical protein n=1 Tax=Arthrobacter sp. zg-Y40 TaxID=2886939 RepID=UPI001D148524|nr:hypothetical protein [Arthrobacter sp. zg-Y40]MCC3279705.1 hypothetical protein [Arthrobacter sp. zg-Y40]